MERSQTPIIWTSNLATIFKLIMLFKPIKSMFLFCEESNNSTDGRGYTSQTFILQWRLGKGISLDFIKRL